MLEAYYGEIVARIQTASAGLSDIRGAIQALDALSKNQKGEFLLPIGGGVLLPLGNVEASKLIVSVGAGVAVEKNLDSARTYLQAREKELQNALSALEQQRREIGSRLETGRSILQQLSGQG
jgi:prefoldin alpha subunit